MVEPTALYSPMDPAGPASHLPSCLRIYLKQSVSPPGIV
jgi:hypothetical protein